MEKKPLIDYEVFLMGIKPALYVSTNVPNHVDKMHLFKKYPFITENISLHNEADFFLFFQTEPMKKEFQKKLAKVEHLSPEFHELIRHYSWLSTACSKIFCGVPQSGRSGKAPGRI